MLDRVVRGQVVTGETKIENGWIGIEDGKIAAVGTGPAPVAAQTDDFGNALVLPGIVDGQTHATSYKGLPGIADTTRSAIAGGVTTLVDMPYDNPLPLDRPERFAAKAAAVETYAYADFALYGTVTAETDLTHVAELVDMGCVAFKISFFESSPTRFPRIGTNLAFGLLETLRSSGLPLGLHNEDQEIVLERMEIARKAGVEGIVAHSESRPPAAEHAATAQFLALGAAAGAHAHLVHISEKTGFDIVRGMADFGALATGELCVHYLRLDAAGDGDRLGARMKVNPPIRAGALEGLWRAVEEGNVAFISSDHSSWPIDNKLTASIFDAGAGVPGVETLLPVFYTLARDRGLDPAVWSARMLAERPARFFGIDDRKGAIETGRDADLVVLEEGEFVWDEAQAHDGLNWSPFHGDRFAARVAATYLRGALAWDGQSVLTSQGDGDLIKRSTKGWYA